MGTLEPSNEPTYRSALRRPHKDLAAARGIAIFAARFAPVPGQIQRSGHKGKLNQILVGSPLYVEGHLVGPTPAKKATEKLQAGLIPQISIVPCRSTLIVAGVFLDTAQFTSGSGTSRW